MSEYPKMLRISEIAKRFSVSIRAVHYWIADGYLPAVRVHGRGMWLVSEEDLEVALRANGLPPGRKRERQKAN